MLNDDMLFNLQTEMFNYIQDHGLPSEPQALEWFQLVAREGTTAEEAFAPMYDGYFKGLGFPVDEWLYMTKNIEGISIRPDRGGGVEYEFDFDYESDDGQYEGSRTGSGYI